ncbi:MAG TPA: hypothetical protein PLM07_10725 [Candidatus Rifleibacterium sp.]|nr:hypothetical protein [Candidatus Rifleibacterium sp.]HPT46365.1 hypothetical protein [Candidatus Rifleibacterium sp.]
MQTRQISVEISQETYSRLQKAAEDAKTSPEAMATDLITRALQTVVSEQSTIQFPGVALIKNNFSLPATPASSSESAKAPELNAVPATTQQFPQLSKPMSARPITPEAMQRRLLLETRIRELSLLIDTAEPDKKEDYLLQYAMLAAELDSII